MRKIGTMALAALVLLAAVFAVSCNKSNAAASAGGKTSLLLWLPPFASDDGAALDKEFWTRQLASWADENKVNLNIEITPWSNYEEKYLTGFSSGDGPDVGYMYNEMLYDFIQMGTLEKLDSYFNAEEKGKYLHFNLGNILGAQYTVPFVVGNGRILYFNKDLLAKGGVTTLPRTWDEFIQTGLKLKNANLGSDIIVFSQEWAESTIGGLNNNFYPYLWQAGGELFDSNGKIALLQNDGAVRAAQFLYDLMYVHGITSQETLALTGSNQSLLFRQGKIAMAVMAASVAKTLNQEGTVNWDFVPSLEDKKGGVWVAADALIVNSASKNKDAAVKLAKYITLTPSVMEAFHKELSSYPPISKDEAYVDEARFKEFYETSPYLKSLPVAANAATTGDFLQKALQRMMHKEITPKQAIEDTVNYYNSMQ
jgi:multiple sugar transport system substrate-binding protein